ncbi:MAG: sugar transferase, partial [Clostridia bacterium]|nr:sugar transferase [Clostridia bacterium]
MFNFFKRFCDIVVSLVAVIVLSPLLLLLCLLTAIFNGAPVVFKQPRPGKDGKIFMLYKFRSMSNKTDANGNLLPDSKRITKFGKFLRASSLDELPQLFNIIK